MKKYLIGLVIILAILVVGYFVYYKNQNVQILSVNNGSSLQKTGCLVTYDGTVSDAEKKDSGLNYKWTLDQIKAQSSLIENKLKEGFTLRQVCEQGDKNLLFFDFKDGYWKAAGKVNDDILSGLAKDVVIGVSGKNFENLKLYSSKIDGYRLEGEGSCICRFNGLSNDKVLYTCVNASSSGGTNKWYVFDLGQEKNVLVKITSWTIGGQQKENILDQSLIKLFQ